MKNIIRIFSLFFIYLSLLINRIYSDNSDWGILWDENWEKLRKWEVWFEDIPNMITYAINFFMGIAASVAVIFIIVWAYKILFGALQQDKTKWRDTIVASIMGFALASLSWFIVKLILDNFS